MAMMLSHPSYCSLVTAACVYWPLFFLYFDDLRQPPKGIEIIFGPVPQGIGDYGVKVRVSLYSIFVFRVVPGGTRGGVCPRDPLRIVVVIRGDDPLLSRPRLSYFVHRHIAAGFFSHSFQPEIYSCCMRVTRSVVRPAASTHGFFNDSCWQPVTVVFVFSYVAFRVHLPDQATVVRVVGVFSI